MSKSKYRLISVIGIVAAIAIMGLGIVSIARQGAETFGKTAIGQNLESNVIEVAAANSLEMDGVWEIVLTNGKPSLTMQTDANQLKNINFSQNGNLIKLKQNSPNFGGFGRPVKVEISMPDLQAVSLSGAGSVNISGFTSNDLTLTVQGGCSLTMKESTVQNLILRSEGASSVDLAEAVITNAEITLQGASNATINMAGGRLTGSIEGVGRLAYSGSVSSEDVRTEGLAKVEKK